MSWLRVDDAFTDNPKVLMLTDSALAMWLRVSCWSQREANRHLRGFIPRKLLPAVSRKSPKVATALAKELVEANAGKEHGLWEDREDGWQIHDWEDYIPPTEKMSRAESARIAGKKSAEARRARDGTAQPRRSEPDPNESESFDTSFVERRSADVRPNEDRTSRTPVPVPVPGEDPPTPLPEHFQRFDAAFRGQLPDQRSDVRQLHAAWKKTFRFHGDKLRQPYDVRAKTLAEAIDNHGMRDCLRVLAQAPSDGMVSGREDEKKQKHETIDYIFGNANAFARILRAADDADERKRSSANLIEDLKSREVAS